MTDTGSGVILGVTPFEKKIGALDRALELRLSKEGFVGVSLQIPSDADFDRTVPLERAKTRAHHHEPTPALASRAAAAPAVATHAPAAPAAPTPPPPVACGRRPGITRAAPSA